MNPESLYMSISVSENDQFFFNDSIKIQFNFNVEQKRFEELVILKINNQITNVSFAWHSNNTVYISPENNWKCGYKYLLSIEGNLQTTENGTFSVYAKRHFTYGEKDELFILESFPSDELLQTTDSLTFSFNKPVEQSSFISGFSISPYADYEIIFSTDSKNVTIKPKNNWPINSNLTWSISNDILSADYYVIKKEYAGIIKSLYDLTIPDIITVCPVALQNESYTPLKDLSLSNLIDNQAIYFEFSKPMNYESIENGISIEPSIKGCFYKIGTNKNEFIFQPYENYTLQTKYHLKISDSCKDSNGIELLKPLDFYFYTSNEYLEVSSIKVDSANTPSIELCNNQEFSELILNKDKSTITVTILFSQDIKNKIDCENNISMTVLFPSSDSPEKQSCTWSSDSCIILTYNGIRTEPDKQYFYKISIKGTSSGVISKNNDFMKENKCVVFKTAL